MAKKNLPRNWEIPKFKAEIFHSKKTKYCIGIPVINEGENLKKQLEGMKDFASLTDIIIFDGGSTDGSTKTNLLKSKKVRALLVGPKGQGRQLRMGLSWAMQQGYEGVITIDGNNKDGIEAIPKFIKGLEAGFDYLQGSRFIKGGGHNNTPFVRYWGNRLLMAPLLSLGAHYWYTDTTNGFRGYSRKYLLHPEVQPFRNIFVKYDLLFYMVVRANRVGLKTKEVPVSRSYPKGKVPTKITGFKVMDLVLTAFKVAFGFYNRFD